MFYFSTTSSFSYESNFIFDLVKHFVYEQTLYQVSGFIDIDNINPDAWPALVADASAGEQGIVALAFGKS